MPRTNDSIDLRIVSKISSMYYNQGYNQQDIADRMQLSRPKVSRLLKQAREQGIVQISVIPPDESFIELEESLEKKYQLKEVLIVEANASEMSESDNFLKKQMGIAAAGYLLRTISRGDIIGVSWGTTLQAMIDAMSPKPMDDLHIVQTLGGVGPPEAKAYATDIARRLSQLLAGHLTLLPAPGIVRGPEAKEVLLSDQKVKDALHLFSKINTLYVGLGALETNLILNKKNAEIPSEIIDDLMESEAVGDIALRFFDKAGKEIKSKLQDMIIGISLEELKKIDTVVGVAGGSKKIDAIQGALNGNYIDVLITDDQTATHLLSTKE